ncbi:MAG: hypothetical protein FJZ92_02030 [Chloroflexi bacterium]|nr:hypothetical protein [Chloroflexota bacterium]
MSEQLFLRSTLVATMALSACAALRYLGRFRHSRVSTHGALATGAMLILLAQIGMHFGTPWALSWWLYHIELLAGFSAALSAILGEYARGVSAVGAIRRFTLHDSLELIEAGYGDVVRSFHTSLEARDRYTHGHGRRVAILAVLIGRQLGLRARAPARARAGRAAARRRQDRGARRDPLQARRAHER